MKKYSLLLVILIPISLSAQKTVQLSVHQPPELGFTIGNRDTTIILGDSLILGKNLLVTGGTGSFTCRWSPGATLNDSTAMMPVAKPRSSTTYLLTVTDKTGCSFSLDYKVKVRWATPVPDIMNAPGQDLSAVIFPNPNEGRFRIALTGKPCPEIRIDLIDISGRRITTRKVYHFSGNETVTMQMKLPAGIYTILVTGSSVLRSRIIIR